MLLEHWAKSTRSSRNVVLAALVLIGAISVYNWIVAPHANYLLAAQKSDSVAGALAKKEQIISNNVAIKKKELQELQQKFKQAHSKLFDPIEAREFFSDIQDMSEEVGCIIHSLNFSQTSSAPGAEKSGASSYITANRATLSVVGNYGNIVALMNKLQNRLKQVWINPVSIKLISNPDRLKCDMTITIYVIQNKERRPND